MELATVPPLRRIGQRLAEGIDSTLLILILLLSMLGLRALLSATYESPARVLNKLANLGAAMVAMWLVAQIPPRTLMRFAVPAYVIGLALLLAVAIAGDVANGARRWLHVGVTRFQPAEVMKLALPLMLAWYFHRNESTLRLRHFAVAALLLVVPVAFIVRQPDLGTAALVAATGFGVIFFAGLSWRCRIALRLLRLAPRPLLWGFRPRYHHRR